MNDRRHPRPMTAARAPASRARLGVALAAAAMSTACGVMPSGAPTYVEPPQGVASAKVRIVNTHPDVYYADIAVFDSPTCFTKASLGMTGGNSRDQERVGMLDDRLVSSATLERYVRADEPLVIGPRAVFPTVTSLEVMNALLPEVQSDVRARQAGVCRMPTFTPKAGEQYEVEVDLRPARCTVTPFHLVGAEGAVRREPVETQPSRISTHEFDLKCFR